jgi:type III secretory pathway lipoprotein EscJ
VAYVKNNIRHWGGGLFRRARRCKAGLWQMLVVSTLLGCLGCGSDTELAQNISQRQSLLIVSVLSKAGITASTVSGQGSSGRFSIYVDKKDYARATSVLVENGLPGEEEQSLGDLLEGSAFLPQSRLVEALRIDRALAIEIQQHLESLPNVTGTKVLVRTVPNGAISERGVSVLLFVAKDATSKIDKQFVEQHVETMFPDVRLDRLKVSVVEGMQSNKIGAGEGPEMSPVPAAGPVGGGAGSIEMSPPQVPFLWIWSVKEQQYTNAAALVLLFFLISGVVGAAVGIWWMSYLSAQIRKDDNKLPGLPSRKTEKSSRGGETGSILDERSVTGNRRITGGSGK